MRLEDYGFIGDLQAAALVGRAAATGAATPARASAERAIMAG
jgi:hypothetical protein